MTTSLPLPWRRWVTDRALPGPDEENAIGDRLTDLMHRADSDNFDPDRAFERPRGRHEAETSGEVVG